MIAYRNSKKNQTNSNPGGAICVAGVGGAGCNVLDRMALEGMTNAELVAINCDVRALQNTMCPRQLQLGAKLTRGLGTGGDPELGRDAAIDSRTEISELFKDRDMVFLCAGLGGGTGSGATPQLVKAAREQGAFVVVFAILPFSFEGRRRLRQAHEALAQLRSQADVLVVFENDRMGELALNKEGIQQAFAAADTVISQSIRSIHTLVRQPGLIQIGMDDLMSALRNEDARCLFGYGDAKGENRAHEALKRALKSPLINQGELLGQTSTILVHVAGGETLTLFEVELLMRELEKQVPEDAHILFGTAIDPKLGDLLSVSIISSLSATRATDEPVSDTTASAAGEKGLKGTPSTPTGRESQADAADEEAGSAAGASAAGGENPAEGATTDLPGLDVEPTPPQQAPGQPQSAADPSPITATRAEPAGDAPAQTGPAKSSADATSTTDVRAKADGPPPANALSAAPNPTYGGGGGSTAAWGRRLPDFNAPLTQIGSAVVAAPRESLLKSLANGSVPLEKLNSGPLAARPTESTIDPATKVPPPLEAGGTTVMDEDSVDDPDINPIAAAMRSAGGSTEASSRTTDAALAAKAAASKPTEAPVPEEVPEQAIAPVDSGDQRDFGRPEEERRTIEPFPLQKKSARQQPKTAATAGHSSQQAMLDLDPGSKGRFDRVEPSIVDGEDLDVPAFLRRSR